MLCQVFMERLETITRHRYLLSFIALAMVRYRIHATILNLMERDVVIYGLLYIHTTPHKVSV